MENNLFPESANFEITDYVEDENQSINEFKKTYSFNFEKGEFARGADGKVVLLDRLESYMQWCQKALLTKRMKHLAYTDLYAQEYYTLIGEPISKAAVELEVERMTRETLMVHPYTKEVENFKFEWNKNKEELLFIFDVLTVLDELFTLERIEEMR